MNRYEIQADVEFVIFAKSESEAFELADNKLANIPSTLKITGVSIRKDGE